MKSKLPIIPIFWDVDLTITEEYQQEPLFRANAEAIRAKLDRKGRDHNTVYRTYWDFVERMQAESGVSYLQQMIWDAQEGEPFDGLTNDDLFMFGREVKMAPGFKEAIAKIEVDLEGRCEIHHFFVSVGIQPMVEGIVDANGLSPYVKDISASKFLHHDNRIGGIQDVVHPFGKNERIIGYMKGGQHLLNVHMPISEYAYDFANMIVIGDGFTDTSKFAYAKKKGGTPIVVYTAGDKTAFDKMTQTVRPWADLVLPRDYTPGGKTYTHLLNAIEQKLYPNQPFHPQALHDFKKGSITDPAYHAFVKAKLAEPVNAAFFNYLVVHPSGWEERGSTLHKQ